MQSLRTRRPSEPRPKLQKREPTIRQGRASERKSTRVDDKIKKRMSMRYADISSPTGVSVPAVPALPLALRPGYKGQDIVIPQTDEPREDTKEVEKRLLDQDEFDPDAYLKLKMANSTEAELRSLQSSLQASKDEVSRDLQRNVFKNYAEFVMVSKEVSTLESEMLELKEALAEWKGMPSLLHIDDSASVAERRRNVRSSIADLRVLYATQMQNLHNQIEGCSKFVPTTPGRHVVLEMDSVLALNPATYKVDHSVHFVLLDDAVLVARRRRRRNNGESDKLIAERCWPLNEMLVLDTKDTQSMTNVFKIRHNKETHVYRTEVAADKKHLLVQFRHVAEELASKRRKEREGEHQRRKSLWVNGDRTSQAFPPDVPPLPDFLTEMSGNSELGSSAKEKAERDARWLGDFCDDLTVAIALRKWDHAVALLEEGESRLDNMPLLGTKLTPLKSSLTSALLQSLSSPNNRKSTVVHLISMLARLKAGAAARNTFLASRTEVMHKRVRMITFEGHIGMYISDLAIVVFTGIKHTADWFLASFKENEVASCFVEWAKKQVEAYAEMFRKQVYGSDVDPQTVEDAKKITQAHSKKLLEEYGLDFRFLLGRLLSENPGEEPRVQPPTYRPHTNRRPSDPAQTPPSTPVRSRSPAPAIAVPIPSRMRSPAPSSIASSPATSTFTPPAPSPAPSTASSMTTSIPRTRINSNASGSAPPRPDSTYGELVSKIPGPRPPPRANSILSSRSTARPGSATGHRPPPVAVPKREGMF
ncbi:uncharacterized protein PHACADRAFT_135232 [Phanerochaete carnosa HHB-10118-sp]|uniref:Exocyst complex component EXO84 n=1 Tax=Phanerochaete carnosa (strain HHB-10118-sp) TaxID=650164 RepID=K5XEK9_PHACS|nr:uncharacterized protein PHACADRAFT_135232 [Phanerochaete carnosa HHB-10118-sp]EKM61512.1 hypothetical protein PHACADRAFT_135232 [Phanerochaete carnosa HHB-10118-sp]